MKLKFKVQAYQSAAVDAVVDCFEGQDPVAGVKYRMDPGRRVELFEVDAFRNADLTLGKEKLLDNIKAVQRRANLPISTGLTGSAGCDVNLDVEMETGTGKTYCYIKTMFEMSQRFGWNKFVVVVPSIAIREGVLKGLEITAEHFLESYGKRARFFAYNSSQLHQLESFSSDGGINVMVINIQAFNATGKDNRRIYEELDDFQSRRPIDVISRNRPILILDEPQKMSGKKTMEGLAKFTPLMILRYSATHRETFNKIHRLDALDAYNQKLVKKIEVRGITVKGLSGTSAYLFLESIETSKQAPVARIEMEVKTGSGIKRVMKRLTAGRDLYTESNGLDQYKGYVISQIDARVDTVEFTNGKVLALGDATGDVTEETKRRIQIRETIKAHILNERRLFSRGVKVLSLFFIDEVAKYRDYSREDEKGDYARIFEEEYASLRDEALGELELDGSGYKAFLESIPVANTHDGYFSIDKKTSRLADPNIIKRGEDAGLSDDVDAYDLILKDKESLLSLPGPKDDPVTRRKREVRFIFSHSALREGWDNPNVFVMCMLKHSDNTISRRQEVGRGLRLCVNQAGERLDHPATVHEINVLTVVASESYQDFVKNLQREISESLSERPRRADEAYFHGKVFETAEGLVPVDAHMAKQIYKYLLKNDYTDLDDHLTAAYHDAKDSGTLAALPEELKPHAEQIFKLIDGVFSEDQIPVPGDGRKTKINPLNANFEKKEFKALWERINRKAVYRVDFDSEELIRHAIRALDKELRVTPLTYIVERGEQTEEADYDSMKTGAAFATKETSRGIEQSLHSRVTYDLLGKLAEGTHLTRRTLATILEGLEASVFKQFRQNPEHFLSEAGRIINEQKACILIERLRYDATEQTHDADIFTQGQAGLDFSLATEKLQKHIYDYVATDSKVERKFVAELDTSTEVVVYAKLPRGFFIPTPVGNYNPDWAISFKEGSVKHVYFVAETKGSMSTLSLRGIEERKIECARRFFSELNQRLGGENVKYDVVDSFGKLMDVVGVSRSQKA